MGGGSRVEEEKVKSRALARFEGVTPPPPLRFFVRGGAMGRGLAFSCQLPVHGALGHGQRFAGERRPRVLPPPPLFFSWEHDRGFLWHDADELNWPRAW